MVNHKILILLRFLWKGIVVLSIETFIVLVGLIAAAGGSLILLSFLAGKRAFMVKAFMVQQQMEECNKNIKDNQLDSTENVSETIQTVSSVSPAE